MFILLTPGLVCLSVFNCVSVVCVSKNKNPPPHRISARISHQNSPPESPARFARHTVSRARISRQICPPHRISARFARHTESLPEFPTRFAHHSCQNSPPDLPTTHTESPPEFLTRFARHAEFPPESPARFACPSLDPVFYQLCCSLILL
jgi:hypothetical protein